MNNDTLDLVQYIGQTVFLEAALKDDSHYYDGEYIVVNAGSYTLQVVKATSSSSVYEWNSLENKIIGEAKGQYRIARSRRNDRFVRESAQRALAEANDVIQGRKKANWVDYVYTNARANAEKVLVLLDNKSVEFKFDAKYLTSCQRDEVILIVKDFFKSVAK